jgi:hypothetical protein
MPVVVAPGSALLALIQPEMEVTWNQGGVYYAGRIRAITPRDEWRADYIELDIECQDYTSLLNDEICTSARSVVETDAQRISWLLQSFDRRGISARNVQTLYSSMPAQDFTGMTLTAAITAVLAFSGGGFYVDDFKDLHTFIAENLTAPFSLSDNPDNVTSFGYNSFQYPQDSVDLRNAVYGIPTNSIGIGIVPGFPGDITHGVILSSGLPVFPASGSQSAQVSIKPATNASVLSVIGAGDFTVGSNTTVTPNFLRPTSGANVVLAAVTSDGTEPLTTAPGWGKIVAGIYGPPWAAIWGKANSSPSEPAPTFTSSGGAFPMHSQLLEIAGADQLSPFDVTAYANGYDNMGTNGNTRPDSVLGELVFLVSRFPITTAATATFSELLNDATGSLTRPMVNTGNSGALITKQHSSVSYGFTYRLASPTWYTDETSITLYGRREASFTAPSTVTTQTALDALGNAYIKAHSNPLKHSSLLLPPGSPVGLTAGQTISVTNSLYGLAAQPFRIQSVDITYPADDKPQFAVQFADPVVTVTTQLVGLQAQITSSGTAATQGSLGSLAFVSSTSLSIAGITAQVDLTGLAVTANILSGRRIRFTAQCSSQATVATDLWYFAIMEGATQIQSLQISPGTTANVVWPPLSTVATPSAGSHTYKLVGARASGTGSFTANSGAGFPAFLLIEDIGT